MRRNRSRPAVVLGLMLIGVGLALFEPSRAVLQVVLALILVFIAPGTALISFLFDSRPVNLPVRIALTLGISMSITILTGLALNATVWGVRPEPWASVLIAITVLAYGARWLRDRSGTVAAAFGSRSVIRVSFSAYLLAVLTMGGVGLAYWIAQESALQERGSQLTFTQFWMLPGEQSPQLHIGIRNLESQPGRYSVRLESAGSTLATWDAIELDAGATWKIDYDYSMTLPEGGAISAFLYRDSFTSAPVRRVDIHLAGER